MQSIRKSLTIWVLIQMVQNSKHKIIVSFLDYAIIEKHTATKKITLIGPTYTYALIKRNC